MAPRDSPTKTRQSAERQFKDAPHKNRLEAVRYDSFPSTFEVEVSFFQDAALPPLPTDMVFGDDGGIHQIASMSGSVAKGYTAALTIGV